MNLNVLSNITPPSYNFSNFSNPETLITTAQSSANSVSNGYFGLSVMVILFLFLLITLYRDDGDIRMDIARSVLISSGLTLIVGVFGLLTNFFISWQHVMWFGLIFIISLVAIVNLKKKNL